jgi:SAM-dependent methyltransferase
VIVVDEAVVGLWERAAKTYEREVPYFGPMGEQVVALAKLESGESILDVACGKGSTLIPAGRAVGESRRAVGIDVVPAMVEAAQIAAHEAGAANVTVHVMDGEALQFADHTFDVVICAFGLGFLRPEVALPEMARVLRRLGRFVTSVPAGGGPNWEFFGELCRRYGLESAAHPGGSTIPTPDQALAIFARAGFTMEPPAMGSVSVLFPDVDSWWRWVWSHGQRAFLERLNDDNVDSFKEEAAAALESFATSDGIPLEQQFIVFTGLIAPEVRLNA